MKVMIPAPTRIDSIRKASASGPNTSIPNGIASAITMPTNPNTRPWRSGSTVSWSSVIDGVEKNGTASPMRSMTPKKTHSVGARPSAIVSAPNTSEDPAISAMRFQPPASVATRTPPTTMPTLNDISRMARFTTSPCSPDGNERTTMIGVRFEGATVSTKMIANRMSSQRTNACVATYRTPSLRSSK